MAKNTYKRAEWNRRRIRICGTNDHSESIGYRSTG